MSDIISQQQRADKYFEKSKTNEYLSGPQIVECDGVPVGRHERFESSIPCKSLEEDLSIRYVLPIALCDTLLVFHLDVGKL